MTTPFKTPTHHKAPYQSISPLRLELTQANRTVIITGGATGIGWYLLNIATNSIHAFVGSAPFPSYILTKNSGALAIQMVAKDVEPKDMQVLNFHPGTVFTDMVKGLGIDGSGIAFDDPELPGNFAVWAASPEAEFLHGRFVWANWDVDELRSDVPKRIEEEANFLKVGVIGLS